MDYKEELITPEMAREYLSTSLGNRKLSQDRVKEYAEYVPHWATCRHADSFRRKK